MLAERPAERHVHELHPAADPEHGQVAGDRPAGQREFGRVALGDEVRGLGVGLGAVAGGTDVIAAGQDEAVEQVEHLVGVLLEVRVRRKHERQATGALDGLYVADGQQRGVALPHPPAGAGQHGADADHGSAVARPVHLLAHPSLNLARWIFPDAVLGSASANSTMRGYLYGAVSCLTCSWSSVARSRPGA